MHKNVKGFRSQVRHINFRNKHKSQKRLFSAWSWKRSQTQWVLLTISLYWR